MKSLRWIGKIAAVVSALALGSAYVASRSFPGLLPEVQAFGGEGGGQAVQTEAQGAAKPSSEAPKSVMWSSKSGTIASLQTGNLAPATTASKPRPASSGTRKDVIMPSSKSAAIFDSSSVVVGAPSARPAPRASASAARPPVQPSHRAVLSDSTVIQVPGEAPARSQQAPRRRIPPNVSDAPQPAANQAAPQKPQRQQQIMPGSKSAPVILYNGQN